VNLGLAGCGDRAEDSRQQMHKLQQAMIEYAVKHEGEWPDRLDQLKDKLGGEAELRKLMKNPLTGDDPGYEYVKPPGKLSDSNPRWQQAVLYQLRGGKRDTNLKVGYADGSVRPLETDTPTSSSPQGPKRSEWKDFTSKEDGFTVSFPTTPEIESKDNQYDFGKVTVRMYTSNPREGVFWRVATHHYPEPFASETKPKQLIEMMRDGMAENTKSKVEGVQEISLEGHPGQEFVLQGSNPITTKPLTMKVRLFAVRGRVYQLAVVAPLNDDSLGEEASLFFKSFRLLKQ
jgi:hypothetical protein